MQGGDAEAMEVDSPSSLKLASCSVDGTARYVTRREGGRKGRTDESALLDVRSPHIHMLIHIPFHLSLPPSLPPSFLPSLPPSPPPRRLWSVSPGQDKEGKVLQVFNGHAARLASCAFHPCGRYLGTTSWDYTWRYVHSSLPPSLPRSFGLWSARRKEACMVPSNSCVLIVFVRPPSLPPSSRLWDVETGQELLLQDGHYKETHAIAFQVGRVGGREGGKEDEVGSSRPYLPDTLHHSLLFLLPSLRPSLAIRATAPWS